MNRFLPASFRFLLAEAIGCIVLFSSYCYSKSCSACKCRYNSILISRTIPQAICSGYQFHCFREIFFLFVTSNPYSVFCPNTWCRRSIFLGKFWYDFNNVSDGFPRKQFISLTHFGPSELITAWVFLSLVSSLLVSSVSKPCHFSEKKFKKSPVCVISHFLKSH